MNVQNVAVPLAKVEVSQALVGIAVSGLLSATCAELFDTPSSGGISDRRGERS
jgi:hypothetical protein